MDSYMLRLMYADKSYRDYGMIFEESVSTAESQHFVEQFLEGNDFKKCSENLWINQNTGTQVFVMYKKIEKEEINGKNDSLPSGSADGNIE